MLKWPKFSLKTHNLKNTAIKVIIITEKHLQGSATQQHYRQINLECCANNTQHADASP